MAYHRGPPLKFVLKQRGVIQAFPDKLYYCDHNGIELRISLRPYFNSSVKDTGHIRYHDEAWRGVARPLPYIAVMGPGRACPRASAGPLPGTPAARQAWQGLPLHTKGQEAKQTASGAQRNGIKDVNTSADLQPIRRAGGSLEVLKIRLSLAPPSVRLSCVQISQVV